MFASSHHQFSNFAVAGALTVLTTVGTLVARADDQAQNLGPVAPHEPILASVGSKRIIEFYLPGGIARADIPADKELVRIVVLHLMTHDCDTGELLNEYWGDRSASFSVSGNRVEDCREYGVKKARALSAQFRRKYPNASTNVACKWMTVLRLKGQPA